MMKTTPQLRGGAFVGQGSAHGTRSHNRVTGHRGSGWKCWQAHFHFKRHTRDTEEFSLRPPAQLGGHWVRVTRAVPQLRAPLSAPLAAVLIMLTDAPAVAFPPRHHSRAVPRARSCPEWVSPVPALCPAGPAGAVAPSPSAWLGRSFFWPLLPSSGI